MKKQHKKYSKPKRPFDKTRIDEEAVIKEKFGLKNKREIWKAQAKIKLMRGKAKKLISSKPEEQQVLFKRLQKIGLKVESIADILSLEPEDFLKRRLQTFVSEKFKVTPKKARQLITHKKVLVKNNVVDSPSYVVPKEIEGDIKLKEKKVKVNKSEGKEENA